MTRRSVRNREAVYLNPGELHIARRPTDISTLLGSCVAIALHHPKSGLGALCHALLPHARSVNKPQATETGEECFRYVDCALRHMIAAFDERETPRREIVAKLFGGADMFETPNDMHTVGVQNIEAARRILSEGSIILSVEQVGGDRGRKLHFLTDTGDVLMKRIKKADANDLVMRQIIIPEPKKLG